MINPRPEILTDAFRTLSARLGSDPLQVQGPGGNTSIKNGDVMWIKASGTELANAEKQEIFVAVDRTAAQKEAAREAGDGSCKSTVLDPELGLRPSIETTFHAALDHCVVAHTHSVATIAHAICKEGRASLDAKLSGLDYIFVPYAKPGLPLTEEILSRTSPTTTVIVLGNHGLICCGSSVEEVEERVADVEDRLKLEPRTASFAATTKAPAGFHWAEESWIATDERASRLALEGSYYPDHVVFLGPALPDSIRDVSRPAVLLEGEGIALRNEASPSQKAMLRCLSDVLSRLPAGWTPEPIGQAAEASLLNWDAEKYRQALAAKS